MQRRNEWQPPGRRHGAGQQGADRVRNRVVYVQQVQIFRFGYLHHFYRKRERVGRVVEQGIARNLHFVEMNSVVGVGQAYRRSVADEMNLMPAHGQFHSQFGSHDARAAVSGVTCDPYLHMVPSVPLVLLLKSVG